MLQNVNADDRSTQIVILSPTRELCLQIADDLKDYSRYIDGLHVVAVYGGTGIESQIRQLRKGCQIIVATPGRLIDLIHRGAARLESVRNVVLDEADEMLNMGFTESIDEILSAIPSEHQTLLFSATMGPDIERIAKNYLRQYREIVVGSRNEGAEHVNHIYYAVRAQDKYAALKRIVDYYPRIYATFSAAPASKRRKWPTTSSATATAPRLCTAIWPRHSAISPCRSFAHTARNSSWPPTWRRAASM